ncbi:plasmid Maintenance Protein [Cooperia oncophora]
MRPTAALIWAVFGIYHLWRHPQPIRLLLATVLPTAVPLLLLSAVFDSLCYARPTSTLWNFLLFNVLQGGSAHFGVHPWYWYFTEGLTSVLTLQLVPVILGLFSPFRPTILPFIASAFYIAFHSVLPHKEQRFLLPVLPLLCLYAGPFFVSRRTKFRRIFLSIMVIVNAGIALYCGLRHQVGPYNAADSLLSMARKGENVSVAALMPCYSIPGQSYFHNEIRSIRMLDCTPNIGIEKAINEVDQFHEEPEMWLDRHLNEILSYSHILIYEKMFLRLIDTMTRLRYSVCDRVFHSDFLCSDREDHHIIKYSCNGTSV